MAFTRIFYDRDRVIKNLDEDYNNLKYSVNVPGNGTNPYFIDDPQLRMQKFGANLSKNMVDINSTLLGLNQTLSRDTNKPNNGRNGNSMPFNNTYNPLEFPSINSAITDQPRAMAPPWALRDLDRIDWKYLHYDPQQHFEKIFENNVSSRILEKDNFNMCN